MNVTVKMVMNINNIEINEYLSEHITKTSVTESHVHWLRNHWKQSHCFILHAWLGVSLGWAKIFQEFWNVMFLLNRFLSIILLTWIIGKHNGMVCLPYSTEFEVALLLDWLTLKARKSGLPTYLTEEGGGKNSEKN